MTQPHPSKLAIFFLSTVLVFLLALSLLLYTAVHEGGHALLGVLFGGTLTDFNANFWNLSAHVGIRGEFSSLQNALIAAGGVSAPLLLWAIFMLATPVKSNPALQLLRLITGLSAINSLLAWVIIPFLVLGGQFPADDSTNFLRITGIYPPLVSGVAVLVYAGGWALLIRRLGGLGGLWQTLRQAAAETIYPASRTTLAVLAGLFVLTAGLTALLSTHSSANALTLPREYAAVAVVPLAQGGITRQAVYRFQLEQPGQTSFFFVLPTLSSGPAEIILRGPGAYENVFFRAPQDFRGGGTVNPTGLALAAGEYEIVMTFPQVNGQVAVGRR